MVVVVVVVVVVELEYSPTAQQRTFQESRWMQTGSI